MNWTKPFELSAEVSSHLVLFGATIGLVISTLEYLSVSDHFSDHGIFAWSIIKTRTIGSQPSSVSTRLKDILYGHKGTLSILWTRLLILLVILFSLVGGRSHVDFYFVLLVPLLITTLLLNYRCVFGSDGSDQMLTVILIGLVFYFGLSLKHSSWSSIGLWFVALESCLSYLASGISKMLSEVWRSGDAVFKILNTSTYGSRRMAGLLRQSATLRRIACWTVISYECLFPSCMFLPTHIAYIILILGCGFHLFNAVYMGLNVFPWAFVGTYPAVLFCAAQVR